MQPKKTTYFIMGGSAYHPKDRTTWKESQDLLVSLNLQFWIWQYAKVRSISFTVDKFESFLLESSFDPENVPELKKMKPIDIKDYINDFLLWKKFIVEESYDIA